MAEGTLLSALGQAAIAYSEQGWQVFPLAPRTKVPLKGSHGVHDATDDEEQIRAWWEDTPDANIGIAAGSVEDGGSSVWTLDFDRTPEKDGLAVRAEWEEELPGGIGGVVIETARGVQHVFLCDDRSPRACSTGSDGVDIRSAGGYFLAPPSVHPTGAQYRWGRPGKLKPASNALLEKLASRLSPASTDDKPAPASSNGTRPYTETAWDEYRQMLGFVPGRARDDWLRVGFAIHELGWGDRGFQLWDAWSRNWPEKYEAHTQRQQWESFSRGYTGPRITIATLVRSAMAAGWKPPLFASAPDLDPEPIPFFVREEQSGPPILIDELFGGAPRLAAYLHMAREYLQVPESTISLSHLVGLSAATSKRITIDNGKFRQPPVLWLLSLMRTGGRKSEIVDLVRDPFFEIAASPKAREVREEAVERHNQLGEQLAEEQAKPEPSQERIKELRFALAANSGQTVDLAEQIVSDTTEAGLQEALIQSGGVAFICDGEAASLSNAISPTWAASGATPQTTTWLNGFSGKSMKVKRSDKKRRQGLIRNPELAICLIVQTGAPTNYLFEHSHLRDSGFMARFLIDVPDFRPELINVDAHRPHDGYQKPWRDLLEHYLLLGIPLNPRVIHFSRDAQQRFLEFRRLHQGEFRPGGANHDLPEFHNKAQGTLTRVAGLIAAARAFEATRRGSAFVVEAEDLERALALFPKLVNHARVAFGLELDSARQREALRALHAAFRHFPGSLFSARDLTRKVRLRDPRPAIETLVETRWLTPSDEAQWYRRDPRCRFRVSPKADPDEVPMP